MKKLLLLSMLCLAVLSCGKKEEVKEEVAEVSTTQSQDYGVPNPFEIVDTLDEAAKIAGFSLEKTHEGLRIRKANGTDDISGDYNEYKEVNVVKVGELEVTEKGNDGNISIATWTDGTYSYSINVDEALLNVDDISNLISNIK